jgi:hypothetical protein
MTGKEQGGGWRSATGENMPRMGAIETMKDQYALSFVITGPVPVI